MDLIILEYMSFPIRKTTEENSEAVWGLKQLSRNWDGALYQPWNPIHFCISIQLTHYQLKTLTDKQMKVLLTISGHSLIKVTQKPERQVRNFWFTNNEPALIPYLKKTKQTNKKHPQPHPHTESPEPSLDLPEVCVRPQHREQYMGTRGRWGMTSAFPQQWYTKENLLNKDGRKAPLF